MPPPDGQAGDAVRLVARAFERDRYLAALLAPSAVRGDLIALAAFAGELARVPSSVSEPMIGEMRLQWWRDTLSANLAKEGFARESLTGNLAAEAADPANVEPAHLEPAPLEPAPLEAVGHPVAEAVIAAATRHHLPVSAFLDIIDAQSERLDDEPFADLAAFDANTRRWDGGLFALAWRILAGVRDANATPPEILSDAGALYGLARSLVETPVDLQQGRSLLPKRERAIHGATLHVSLGPTVVAAWQAAIAGFATEAAVRTDALGPRLRKAPRVVRLATLPVALVRPYFALSRSADITAQDVRDISPLTRVWRLWLSHRGGPAV